MARKENIPDILSDAASRLGETFKRLGSEAAENVDKAIKDNAKLIEEWKIANAIPLDTKAAYNRGVEDAARVIEELGTNNVGMIHDINMHEAAAIRKLIKA